MKRSGEILSELLEIAPSLATPSALADAYRVPQGYFEGFLAVLMQRIHQEEAGSRQPGVDSGSLSLPYESAAFEIEAISPMLSSLRTKRTYTAPAGYFNSVRISLPETQTSPVVSISDGSASSEPVVSRTPLRKMAFPIRIIRYATAACIVAMLGLTVFKVVTRPLTDPIGGLMQISDQDMANYLEDSDVHEQDAAPASGKGTATLDFNDSEIHELFSSVSDTELEQYLPSLPTEKRNVN